MSEIKDSLRSMVQNLIKDNTTQAELDFHPAFTSKMKEVTGIQAGADVNEIENEVNDDIDHDNDD